ncbi:hypothetical protein K502DRAFT_330139 [Neoconidiobolus thromboides FSU 785]|nr:hypothetical protein K502DRAFT_330139 [Neoconidiobolus thromboides FSU 785]
MELEAMIENNFKDLKRMSCNKVLIDYISWLKLELSNLHSLKDNKLQLLTQKSQFYTDLFSAYLTNSNSPSLTYYENTCSSNYGKFLQNGNQFFFTHIDPYELWFQPNDNPLFVTTQQSNLLSYVYLAVIARFTLTHGTSAHTQIYGQSLKQIRILLSKAYDTPSYDTIVSLNLLSFLSLSHYNFILAKRYLLSSIRMAQCLRFDMNEQEFGELSESEIHYKEIKRGRRLWVTLHLSYLIISSAIKEIPTIKFNTIDPYQFFKINQKTQKDDEKGELCIKELNEVHIKLQAKIEKVKQNSGFNESDKINNQELRLSNKESKYCLVKLSRLKKKYEIQGNNKEEENIEFNIYMNISIELTTITLYYPSLLIIPQPALFSIKEFELLYELSNQAVYYFLNRKQYNKTKQQFVTQSNTKESNKQLNLKHQIHFQLPYYHQLIYCFFVFINILHFDELNIDININKLIVQHSKLQAIVIYNELIKITKNESKNEKIDAEKGLERIKKYLDLFCLDNKFKQKFY